MREQIKNFAMTKVLFSYVFKQVHLSGMQEKQMLMMMMLMMMMMMCVGLQKRFQVGHFR